MTIATPTNGKAIIEAIPSAVDCERDVLRCAIRDRECAEKLIRSRLGEYDWVDPLHQAIFREALREQSFDPLRIGKTLRNRFSENPVQYLNELAVDYITSVHFDSHLDAILRAARARRLLSITDVVREGVREGRSPDDVFRILQADIEDYRRESSAAKPLFTLYTAAELATARFELNYVIDRLLVEGAPCVLGGPKKSLKTTFAILIGICISLGIPLFGTFKVFRPRRVLICSSESGLATIQDIAMRICRSLGVELADVDNLIFSPAVPKPHDIESWAEFRRTLEECAPEVLILDPFYRMLTGDGAENLFKMGVSLGAIDDVCQPLGITLILCHHLKTSRINQHEPADLDDLAYSGLAEFARQWLLITRREKFVDGSGLHRLWFRIGGSAGHNSLWAVDVDEGSTDQLGGRRWDVSLYRSDEARDAEEQRKERDRSERHSSQLEIDKRAIVQAVAGSEDRRGTKTEIRDRCGVRTQRFNAALAELLRGGELEAVEIIKSNNRRYDGFALKLEETGP